jgi:hypothetical protein
LLLAALTLAAACNGGCIASYDHHPVAVEIHDEASGEPLVHAVVAVAYYSFWVSNPPSRQEFPWGRTDERGSASGWIADFEFQGIGYGETVLSFRVPAPKPYAHKEPHVVLSAETIRIGGVLRIPDYGGNAYLLTIRPIAEADAPPLKFRSVEDP